MHDTAARVRQLKIGGQDAKIVEDVQQALHDTFIDVQARDVLAAMGFSIDGTAAFVAAACNRWIDAVVGLDPSFIARQDAPIVRAATWNSPGSTT